MSLYLWNTAIHAEFRGMSPLDVFKTFLFEQAMKDRKTVYADTIRGYTVSQNMKEDFNRIEGIHWVYSYTDRESGGIDFYIIDGGEGFAQLTQSETHIELMIFSVNTVRVKELGKIIQDTLSEAPVKGTVHMLAHENQSFYLVELGEVYSPLERGNYTQTVLEQYDRVIEDLGSSVPSGRLTLLNGLPGSGKSFLIRGIISQVCGLYIYVPASVSGTITGPDIIPLIMREKDKNIPIILLMEDADSSLATRQLDNVSRLSDLLNMSDGILGDMADLRILATTNSRKDDIDKAVIREGRMNEYIQLQPLEETQANQVFLRLVPNQTLQEAGHLFGANTTLAYVYKEARRYGWRPELAPKKRKGYRDLLDYPISPYS